MFVVVVAVVVVVYVVVVVVVVIVVVVVVVVVGHRPLPGWQSGTSDCSGHGLPPADCSRVIIIFRAPPCSHAFVHVLNTYEQSSMFVVVVAVVVVAVLLVVMMVVDAMVVAFVLVVEGRHHGVVRHPSTSSRRSYSSHVLLGTAKSACRAPIRMHRWVLCFHCTIRHVSPCRTHWLTHSLAVVTLLSSMNTLTLTATDDGTSMLVGSLKASFGPNGQPTVVSVGGTHARDAVVLVLVVVVVVVVVVGHRSLPGWQSGTSDCAGHGLPPKDFCRVTVRDLSAPCSHTCVHALNT